MQHTDFFLCVPTGQDEQGSGIKSSFNHAQEEATNDESCGILRLRHSNHNTPPDPYNRGCDFRKIQ